MLKVAFFVLEVKIFGLIFNDLQKKCKNVLRIVETYITLLPLSVKQFKTRTQWQRNFWKNTLTTWRWPQRTGLSSSRQVTRLIWTSAWSSKKKPANWYEKAPPNRSIHRHHGIHHFQTLHDFRMNTNKHTPGWYLPKKDATTNEIRLVSTDPNHPTSPFAIWCSEEWLDVFSKSGVKIICN